MKVPYSTSVNVIWPVPLTVRVLVAAAMSHRDRQRNGAASGAENAAAGHLECGRVADVVGDTVGQLDDARIAVERLRCSGPRRRRRPDRRS